MREKIFYATRNVHYLFFYSKTSIFALTEGKTNNFIYRLLAVSALIVFM